jgi:hypothetical protein
MGAPGRDVVCMEKNEEEEDVRVPFGAPLTDL